MLSPLQVFTVGYIASLPIKELSSKYGMAIKRLLFTNYQGAGRGLAVLLVFKSSKNVEVRREGERERERESSCVCRGGEEGERKERDLSIHRCCHDIMLFPQLEP